MSEQKSVEKFAAHFSEKILGQTRNRKFPIVLCQSEPSLSKAFNIRFIFSIFREIIVYNWSLQEREREHCQALVHVQDPVQIDPQHDIDFSSILSLKVGFFQLQLFLVGLVWLCNICVSGEILTYLDHKHLSFGLMWPSKKIHIF